MSGDTMRRLVAEALGTAILVAVVVGSGIMAERLAGGNAAVALIGNTAATGAILYVLILILGPLSGAHFNPAVTLVFFTRGEIGMSLTGAYVLVQMASGVGGTMLAHAMFEVPLLQEATHMRASNGELLGEAVATFMLVMAILGAIRHAPNAVAPAVALTIVAGYWFTSSTSFANPAVALARGFTDSFSGIRLIDVPMFIVAQITGALLAAGLARWLWAKG